MIGCLNPQKKNVHIIGAGISGLLAGYYAKKAGYQVTIYEKKPIAGGLIQTHLSPLGLCEQAAHSFLASETVYQFCDQLEIPLILPKTKKRFIYRTPKGITANPLTFLEWMKLFFKAIYTIEPRHHPSSTDTVERWAQRFLGKAAEKYLLGPFLQGIYAAKTSEIILQTAFPKLKISPGHSLLSFLVCKKKTSRPQLVTPQHGMQTIIDKLESHLKGHIQYNNLCQETFAQENTIICTPAHVAALFFQKSFPALYNALKNIQYAPLVCATVFIPAAQVKDIPKGIGVLFPREEKTRSLGILFNSYAFAERSFSTDYESFSVMLGGTNFPNILELSDQEIKDYIAEDFSRLFNISLKESIFYIHRWPQAIPIYNEHLKNFLKDAVQSLSNPGLMLFGNYTGLIGLKGLIESAASLEKTPYNGSQQMIF